MMAYILPKPLIRNKFRIIEFITSMAASALVNEVQRTQKADSENMDTPSKRGVEVKT